MQIAPPMQITPPRATGSQRTTRDWSSPPLHARWWWLQVPYIAEGMLALVDSGSEGAGLRGTRYVLAGGAKLNEEVALRLEQTRPLQ